MTFILWVATAVVVIFVIGLCREFAKARGSEKLLRWTLGLGCLFVGAMWLGAFALFGERSDVDVSIDSDVFSSYSKDQYPKTYQAWGESGVERIKLVERAAALKGAKQRKCDRVEYVGLSERMSVPPYNIVVFVDCQNLWRFYVNQDEEILVTEKRK
ncbi:hypothetical protein [Pseudomonas putida]|uniref:hypothetical protein n=1 Tax=Pseudomonas putida TaxID=303 RepID=UPI000F41AD69|nr:hypothetical protein [Pseudomonas putida]RNF61662.1 hypothetical protein EFJ98_29710 [Pseudomonas putida]